MPHLPHALLRRARHLHDMALVRPRVPGADGCAFDAPATQARTWREVPAPMDCAPLLEGDPPACSAADDRLIVSVVPDGVCIPVGQDGTSQRGWRIAVWDDGASPLFDPAVVVHHVELAELRAYLRAWSGDDRWLLEQVRSQLEACSSAHGASAAARQACAARREELREEAIAVWGDAVERVERPGRVLSAARKAARTWARGA